MTHTATLEGRPARTRARLEERLRDSVLCAVGPDTVLEGGRLDMLRSLSHSLPVFLVHLEAEAEEEALEVCEEAAGFTRLRYRPPRGGAGWGALHRHLIERRAIRPILLLEDPQDAPYLARRYAAWKVTWRPDSPLADHFDLVVGRDLVLGGVDPQADAAALLAACSRQGAPPRRARHPLNVLVLYEDYFTYIGLVRDYLEAFADFGPHRVHYAAAASWSACPVDLNLFDVVIFHWTVFLYTGQHLAPAYMEALQRCGSYKILTIHDEYNETEHTRQWIERLGIHAIFTVTPPPGHLVIYPPDRLFNLRHEHILTGYVPPALERRRAWKPMASRPVVLGYRGRAMPVWQGLLAREKAEIGYVMKRICRQRGVPADIEWHEEHRLYGEDWPRFLANCKAVLGTESGANVFDDDGSLKKTVLEAMEADPDLTAEEAYERFIRPHEGKVRTNQIPPKAFEAIALGTVQVLFEGEYSGILQPWVHYIPLKKDFSNVDQVLEKLGDDAYLEAMAERAWQDIVASGRYSYRQMVGVFLRHLEEEVPCGSGLRLLTGVLGAWDEEAGVQVLESGFVRGRPVSQVLPRPPEPRPAVTGIASTPEPPPPPVELTPQERRARKYARLYRIPGARWVHEQLFVRVHEAWEARRLARKGIRAGSPPAGQGAPPPETPQEAAPEAPAVPEKPRRTPLERASWLFEEEGETGPA